MPHEEAENSPEMGPTVSLPFHLGGFAPGAKSSLCAAWCGRSSDSELARTSQVRVDPGLPTLAGLATGLHDVFIEPERDGGFRLAG
jgi:hypothetical protein